MIGFSPFFVTLSFGLASSSVSELSPDICSNITKVIIHYRDYYQFYLGNEFGNNNLYQGGMFVKIINTVVPKCCPKMNVTFVFKNVTNLDTDELVMRNLVQTTTRPRPYEFYFPEFAKEDVKHVYDYELSFVRLKQSQGQAAVMYKPHVIENKHMDAIMQIVNSSGLALISMLVLSWLFGIFGWVTDHWKNAKDFRAPFVVGMFDGFWWSIVTMTTVGYGDKTPKSFPARIVAVIWVMISAVLLSLFTANVTTILDRSLVKTDYASMKGRKVGVLFSKDFVEKQLNLAGQVKNYLSLGQMIEELKRKNVDRLLFPDYKFFAMLSRNEEYKDTLKDYAMVKVFKSPFQIGMVLAIDPETFNKADKMFLRCLRSQITLKRKEMDRDNTFGDFFTTTMEDEEVSSLLSQGNISKLIYYTLGLIGILTCIGIAWDIWQHFKYKGSVEFKEEKSFPVERVLPVLHYNNYNATTLC
ncbi:uncharacterized protein LOC114538066 [Dendronephthya gigantea]|uniref:uncharacterized protein LOC114538066 n=1 Tax=Dendronephthya gigantea TaxID=151771 RepID=UPI00106AECC1|nr:uncharacterized protein LOC114538066 [Dendronephthya gigantea]